VPLSRFRFSPKSKRLATPGRHEYGEGNHAQRRSPHRTGQSPCQPAFSTGAAAAIKWFRVATFARRESKTPQRPEPGGYNSNHQSPPEKADPPLIKLGRRIHTSAGDHPAGRWKGSQTSDLAVLRQNTQKTATIQLYADQRVTAAGLKYLPPGPRPSVRENASGDHDGLGNFWS